MVTGRVQGVFFRASCAREAQMRAVAGWIRNRGDGCVEAIFEGDTDAVAALVAWCHRGPAGASVTRVDVIDEEPTGEHAFRVIGRLTG
jgi:acylphosphatase